MRSQVLLQLGHVVVLPLGAVLPFALGRLLAPRGLAVLPDMGIVGLGESNGFKIKLNCKQASFETFPHQRFWKLSLPAVAVFPQTQERVNDVREDVPLVRIEGAFGDPDLVQHDLPVALDLGVEGVEVDVSDHLCGGGGLEVADAPETGKAALVVGTVGIGLKGKPGRKLNHFRLIVHTGGVGNNASVDFVNLI